MVKIFVSELSQSFDKLIKFSFRGSVGEQHWRGGGRDWSLGSLVILLLHRREEAGVLHHWNENLEINDKLLVPTQMTSS